MIQSKIAFLTEMGFMGKVPAVHPNMRTEFAWMHALEADHFNIHMLDDLKGYDHVFIIFPKGKTFLSSEGSTLVRGTNPVSELIRQPLVETIKQKGNGAVHYIQEGPHWWFNDYEIADQIYFYNFLNSCDTIFTHNSTDVPYYKGLFPNKEVRPIFTLMIEELVKDIVPIKENKAIIGGNFARWYGGFESYIIADTFECEIWAQESHAKRVGEDGVDGIKHFPRMIWQVWMNELSKFKYAVHMMPTVAAGTFSLNCAYFGIPCIGNVLVDTQVSVDVYDIQNARNLAKILKDNTTYYTMCSEAAKDNYHTHYSVDVWKNRMKNYLG